MKALVLGGTKGMGRALARELVAAGHDVCLLGRNVDDLARSVADLRARAPSMKVVSAPCDLEKPESFEPALAAAESALGAFDTVVVTAALFGTQDQLEEDTPRLERLLTVDFTHTVLFCEAARKRLLARGGGTLVVFSSVAGDRGRKPVVLYGAAKAGLTAYCEGLDHRYRAQGLVTVCVKPGFVKTGMTAGLKPPPFAGEPEQVARDVLRAIQRGTPVVYSPAPWAWVMAVIRRLPRFVMRKVGF
jgi:NAD(P)-dependent dehydrogenase (short-subunit alcohol dehydrogenase family)